MYGTFVLLEEGDKSETGERVYLGDVKDRNEGWLRDTLFSHPEIIPIDSIDSAFGRLIPLCKELRTDVGPIDAAFINEHGHLTIVECKLWRNPEARRKVVAQALDYVSAISTWTYADLQRQVSAATGKKINVPFEAVQASVGGRLREQEFIDAVSRSLREGRFLILIAGDGIREGVQSLTALVDRQATKAFKFALVEVAIFRFGGNRLAIQPRVLAETEMIKRQITVLNLKGIGGEFTKITVDDDDDDTDEDDDSEAQRKQAWAERNARLRAWWQPVLEMKFDDPEQEAPRYAPAPKNVIVNTPFPGIRIKAYASINSSDIGVFLSGRQTIVALVRPFVARERSSLVEELPDGTEINADGRYPIIIEKPDLTSDDERRAWIIKTMNTFANVLRPHLRRWYEEMQQRG